MVSFYERKWAGFINPLHFYCIDVNIGFVAPVISVNETDPGPTPVEVCVTSGITGDTELDLVVEFDIVNGEAGKLSYIVLHMVNM